MGKKETQEPKSSKDELEELTKGITELKVEDEAKKTASSSEASSDDNKNELSPSVRTLASWIQDKGCKRILVLCGAGVSVSAGIPDFRSPGTGLYDNLQRFNLPYAEAIFDVEFYENNPDPFVMLASEIWPGLKYAPTVTHSFIALLAQKKLLLRNYTQNIDGLEFLAGIHREKLVECHGHFRSASCVSCRTPADPKETQRMMVEEKEAPKCTECGAFVKPDIVFFGEGLPMRFHAYLKEDLRKVDLILVLGTSLQVAPVSHIPEMVPKGCKRALLNRELVGSFEYTVIDEMDSETPRDVFVGGNCDDSILQLARALGWEEELRAMHQDAQNMFEKKQESA